MITSFLAPLIGRPTQVDGEPRIIPPGDRVEWSAACPACGELCVWSAVRDEPHSLRCDCPCPVSVPFPRKSLEEKTWP